MGRCPPGRRPWRRGAPLSGSEQDGYVLVEAVVSILILAMVLYGAALAVSQVSILHEESEWIYTRSYDLRAAVNMMGEDLHHSVTFWVTEAKKPSDFSAPQGYLTVGVERSRFSSNDVKYHLVPDEWGADGKVTGLKLQRQSVGGTREDILTGLAATSYFDEGQDGAAIIVLEVPTHPHREPLSLRSNFFPRGQS